MDDKFREMPEGHPAVQAFAEYKAGEHYADQREWIRRYQEAPTKDAADELIDLALWQAFVHGYVAAPPRPVFSPIDRNIEAITILAYEAARAALEIKVVAPWDELPEDLQRENVQAAIAIWRRQHPEVTPVFEAVVRTATDMYAGHGGLAIEHLTNLGEFMVNDMGYGEPDSGSIADFVKQKLLELKVQVEELRAEAPGDQASYFRETALELAIKAGGGWGGDQGFINRAKVFESYLMGEPQPFTDAKQGIGPESHVEAEPLPELDAAPAE